MDIDGDVSECIGVVEGELTIKGVKDVALLGMFDCSLFWLKKPGGGKKMHSVFDAFSFFPICISSPKSLKRELIRLTPLIRSSRDLKIKAPSSRYSICMISKNSPWVNPSFNLCPNSCPD